MRTRLFPVFACLFVAVVSSAAEQAPSEGEWQKAAADIDAMCEAAKPGKEYTREEQERWNGARKRWEAMQRVVWRPTCITGKLNGRTGGQRERQEIEGRVLDDRLSGMAERLKKGAWTRQAYEQELLELRAATRRHPAEAKILVALGDLHEAAPSEAIPWYVLATQVADDGWWNYPVQQAWRKLARMHEVDGNYPAAIRALQAWQVCEECGNGSAGSESQKQFWIWRLEILDGRKTGKEIRSEAWRALAEGRVPVWSVSGKRVREWMAALYPKEELPQLDADIPDALTRLEARLAEKPERTSEQRRTDDEFLRILKSMRSGAKEE